MSDNFIPAPPPGIYENVEFEQYLSWDAISSSRINLARSRSLRHFKANVAIEQTRGLTLGSLTHCGKLEPLALGKRYVVMPKFELDPENLTEKGERPSNPRATKYYRLKAADFATANSTRTIVSEHDYDEMVGIVTSLCQDPRAKMYLEAPGQIEVAIVWDDVNTGLRCKARLDHFTTWGKRITDLKTYTPQQGYMTPREKFSRAIANFGYHRQMAHYRNGVRVLTGHDCTAAIVVVENAKPYCCMAAPIDDEWLAVGNFEVAQTLAAILVASETDDWPGYESPESWTAPPWYGSDDEIELVIDGEEFKV